MRCCWVVCLLLSLCTAAVSAATAAAAATAFTLAHNHERIRGTGGELEGKTFGTRQASLTFGLVQSRRGFLGSAGRVVVVDEGVSGEEEVKVEF